MQLLLILQGRFLRIARFSSHPTYLGGCNLQWGEQRPVSESIVAPRIVWRDTALVAEEKGGSGPIEAISEGGGGQGSVEGFRRRAARESDEESALRSNRFCAYFLYECSSGFTPRLAISLNADF
jgi:hypothetical protein